MTVFVDKAMHRMGRHLWCHMWSTDLDELHAFAARLGKSRASFQFPPRASWRHYDLSEPQRTRAIALGAVETDRYGALEHVARLTGDVAGIERIERLRARKAANAGGADAKGQMAFEL